MANLKRRTLVMVAKKADTRGIQVSAKAFAAEAKVRLQEEVEAAVKLEAQVRKRVRHVVPNTFRLGYLLHDVSRMRRTLIDHRMKPEGLTRSQWWVLANLSRKNGAGTMSSELAKQLSVGKVTVGGLVDRLETAGYVFRRAGKADRRAKLIFITVKGYEVIARMREIIAELNRDLVNGLTEDDIAKIERYLFIMKDNVIGLLDEN